MLMQGFPPAPEDQVNLENWQEPPYNRWAFQHVREVIPTQRISRGAGPLRLLPGSYAELDAVKVTRFDGSASTFGAVIEHSYTDAVLVMHDGVIAYERYFNGMADTTPHILMSCTKSLVGCVVGILVDRGQLDPSALVTSYVPELASSGWAQATLRDVLDMRSPVKFSEDYTDLEAEVRVIERTMGWRPWHEGIPTTMYDYLPTLGKLADHDGRFIYRSAETDVLGWICERVSGLRMSHLLSALLWSPMGAEFDADITSGPGGIAVHDGGASASLRDLARFGQLLLEGGSRADVGAGAPAVVPAQWLHDTWHVPDDVKHAFEKSDSGPYLPGGWYRNQFWFLPGSHGTAMLALGIHGQMIYINPTTQTVAVKFSSWPTAQAAGMLRDAAHAFDQAGAALAGVVRH